MKKNFIPAIVILAVILLAAAFRNRIEFGLNVPTFVYFAILLGMGVLAALKFNPIANKRRFWGYLGVYALACIALAVFFAL